eukprot:365171-Chlamydomonas_euryale.AAC.2
MRALPVPPCTSRHHTCNASHDARVDLAEGQLAFGPPPLRENPQERPRATHASIQLTDGSALAPFPLPPKTPHAVPRETHASIRLKGGMPLSSSYVRMPSDQMSADQGGVGFSTKRRLEEKTPVWARERSSCVCGRGAQSGSRGLGVGGCQARLHDATRRNAAQAMHQAT